MRFIQLNCNSNCLLWLDELGERKNKSEMLLQICLWVLHKIHCFVFVTIWQKTVYIFTLCSSIGSNWIISNINLNVLLLSMSACFHKCFWRLLTNIILIVFVFCCLCNCVKTGQIVVSVKLCNTKKEVYKKGGDDLSV